jgi:protein-S-isoprenylcysteine O-methyltransferase Ste14
MGILSRNMPALPLPTLRLVPAAAATALADVAFSPGGVLALGAAKTTINPTYPALLLLLMGWAVLMASTWDLAGPPGFVRCIDRFQHAPEDRVLAGMFGDRFTEYKAVLRRWR